MGHEHHTFLRSVCLLPDQVRAFALFRIRTGQEFIWCADAGADPQRALEKLFREITEMGFATPSGGRLIYHASARKRIHVWGDWHQGLVPCAKVCRLLEEAFPDHEIVLEKPPDAA